MNLKSSLAIFGLSVVFTAGCSHMKNRHAATDMPSAEAQRVAAAEDAAQVAELSFPKGSAQLSETAKQDLRRLIDEAKGKDVKEVKVISWGDEEYPSKSEKKLSSSERDLVKKRNEAIKDYVKTYHRGLDVDTYSMAERPGALKELFNTSDARLKKSLETAGIPTTGSPSTAPSKASKSVIMVITE